jgi:C4-dicarboxylate transporter DctM subunit
VSLPILTNQGYRKSLSSGAVAGSTIGTVIPPSIGYILYGVITGESIGQLFIAGIIPAIIIFSFYCLYIISRSVISKQSLFEVGESMARQSRQDASWKDKIRTLQNASWGLFAPIFVLGGIYMGIFTPSEAAAVMVMYAIVITVLIMKTLTLEQLLAAVLVGAKISSMILLIIVGARIFGAVTSQLGIAADLVAFTERAGIPPIGSLALVSLMLIVLGMFLDAGSIMVITLPVFYPLIMKVGFNSVWFGVFYIIILEIGLLTPPVGLNLFVIKGLSDFPMGTIIRGVLPFIFILFLSLLILTLFPQLVIWLPAVMIK